MTRSASALPDDVDTLKAMVVAMVSDTAELKAETAELKAEIVRLATINERAETRIENLHAIIKQMERARFGRSSEKLDADQEAFAFDEVQTGLGAIEAELEAAKKPVSEHRRPARPRKAFPAHLERVEIVIEPENIACGCGNCQPVRIGEDVSERLDVTPAKFRVIVTRRPKYGCSLCKEGVSQAPAPGHLVDSGVPSEALLAHVAVSKYADGLPLYRQEGIYARDGVEISRNSMANWMGHVGFHLAPLADRILALIKQSERIYADETTLPTLSPGSGKTKTAWLWTYARDDRTFGGTAPPMVAYRFEDSRGGDCVERHLSGYTGLLQVDGWGAYNRLAEAKRAGGPLTLAACWAHLRRKFYELHVSGVSHVASETVERMAKLWAVEEKIRGQDPDCRRVARQEQSAAIVDALWPFWEKELARIPGKSKLAEAIRYARSRREALERFLHDGRLDIDSNAVERAIRPQTITRKNALFAGSDGGGRTWATVATLLQTAKMNGVDPFAWLTKTLKRIAARWPNRDLDQLLPWHHHAD
ncbi:IS66 family transposase [Aminobacter anthyllidis]|uniref:IS66 family transposase n=1 Tax=Aminobacter anthyllidis TaxID=1035067 RepID=UPI002458F044|nr:IS66 family transposase [Aminobacter anthyllidis]MDH4984438.1 IS66 family transposase [Aminobacter anthyllidis]